MQIKILIARILIFIKFRKHFEINLEQFRAKSYVFFYLYLTKSYRLTFLPIISDTQGI